MTQTLEQLNRQRTTLSSIRGIVRTMKTLSAINAVPYEQAAVAIEAYQQTLDDGFAAFAYASQGRYAVTATTMQQRRLLVVFGTDHGLCGNYNEQLVEQVLAFYQAEPSIRSEIVCVGNKLQQALTDRGLSPTHVLIPPASVDGVNRLAAELVQQLEVFTQGTALAQAAVYLVYTKRAEQGACAPLLQSLLPVPAHLFSAPKHWPTAALPQFSLPAPQLLASLLRSYLFVRIYRAAAEAMVTENAARLALMQQAEHAVDERLDGVKRDITQFRQEEITTELMDIISGHLED